MNLLSAPCFQILSQLKDTIEQISPEDLSRSLSTLSGSTIGQHFRHTLEFFLCLEKGFETGVINYDKRAHDKRIETNKPMAISTITSIRDFIEGGLQDKALQLEVCYERHSGEYCTISTSYYRELTYNIEHAIHHMAIIKIGVSEIAPYVKLPDNFGVAISTVRYREAVSDHKQD